MSAAEHFATLALAKDKETRSLALYLAEWNPNLVPEAESSGLLKKGYFHEMMDEFVDEGEECFNIGCNGTFQNEKDPESGGCSCHLGMAPCSHCTSGYFVCDECGHEVRYSY